MPPARHTVITALDFEGTGAVQGHPDEPWQIGMVTLREGRMVPGSAFGSLLRVGDRPFNRYAPGRHAQLRGQLRAAPTLPALWPVLRPRLEGVVTAAHHAATEARYLTGAFPLHPPGSWIDTLKLARIAYPGLPSYKLEDLISRLGLVGRALEAAPDGEPHDALFDAAGCAALLEHLLELPGWHDVTIEALVRARP